MVSKARIMALFDVVMGLACLSPVIIQRLLIRLPAISQCWFYNKLLSQFTCFNIDENPSKQMPVLPATIPASTSSYAHRRGCGIHVEYFFCA